MTSTTVRSHGFTALGPLHEAAARLSGWPAIAVAFLLGAVSAFAFAPFHFSAVLVLSYTGLVWMIDGARAHRRWGWAVFLRGWAFSAGFTLVSMHWTASPFLVDPVRHAVFIWMPLVLLPAGMGLILGAAMAMAGAFWSSSPSRVCVFALFFGLAEWVRGHLFGGFPWNLPGTTWMPGGALSQAASLGGVYWLTLMTVGVMAAPAALVDTREARGLMLRLALSFTAAVLLATAWAWGSERTAEPAPLSNQNIVIMDAGVPQKQWDTLGPDPILRVYLEMMGYPDSKPGDVIVWPEGAVPAYLLQDVNAMDTISAFLGPRTLIAGTTRYEFASGSAEDFYNSLAVMDANVSRTGPLALYDKHRLVPFGELAATRFIPFGEAIGALLPPAIQRMATEGFEPGQGPLAITSAGLPPFVALICYEGLFPEITRRANRGDRAGWIVLISNDGWFGSGMGPAQHYAQNRYRAIESGLPMVRAANRGMSGIIDPYGREILRTSSSESAPDGWKTSYGRGRLPEPAPMTIFQTRLGASLLWFSFCVFAGLAFALWRR